MFHYDRGLFLTAAELGIDICRRQQRGFISHAHSDHMARHHLAFCTPETARLYQLRLGLRPVQELPYGQVTELSGLQLKTLPAGHCLGSAMLWASDGQSSFLYTGDFKLGPAATSQAAAPPRADVLVMECTYGRPEHRFPNRAETIAQLKDLVETAFRTKRTPIFHAYALGKAQEITRLLTTAGVPVQQEQSVYEVSRVYQQCGVDLGQIECWPGYWRPGHAVVSPPPFHKSQTLRRVNNPLRVAVTGWSTRPEWLARWQAQAALPLSDHADFDELLETVRLVNPSQIYCFHGPSEFADHLRSLGYAAHMLTNCAVAK